MLVFLTELMDDSLTRFMEQLQALLHYHAEVDLPHDSSWPCLPPHKGVRHLDLSSNNVTGRLSQTGKYLSPGRWVNVWVSSQHSMKVTQTLTFEMITCTELKLQNTKHRARGCPYIYTVVTSCSQNWEQNLQATAWHIHSCHMQSWKLQNKICKQLHGIYTVVTCSRTFWEQTLPKSHFNTILLQCINFLTWYVQWSGL